MLDITAIGPIHLSVFLGGISKMNRIIPVAIYVCDRCKEEIPARDPNALIGNYGTMPNGDKHCYPCCGAMDREHMIANGKIALYLSSRPVKPHNSSMVNWRNEVWFVANWPNSLRFRTLGQPRKGYHNIARVRYDVWFIGPDRHIWHGVQYGDNTQIVHCKRTKEVFSR